MLDLGHVQVVTLNMIEMKMLLRIYIIMLLVQQLKLVERFVTEVVLKHFQTNSMKKKISKSFFL